MYTLQLKVHSPIITSGMQVFVHIHIIVLTCTCQFCFVGYISGVYDTWVQILHCSDQKY